MRGKFLFITGGLVGYVLGARAGRKRYDQIVAAADNLWNAPPVQRRVNEARDFALERVGDVPSVLLEAGRKVASTLQSKTSKASGTTYTVPTPPATTPATPTPATDDATTK
ncbi:MAG TPA: YtxH domain-containing protein [Cryobacterium sp.]|nr:YtxH domain-containing protein [Cryobacterium sp.]